MGILDNVFETDTKKNKSKKNSTGQHISKKAEKFKEEFSEGLDAFGKQPYQSNGISFTKVSDNMATIKYDGLLAKSGADDVYTMVGYGGNNAWEDVQTIRMNKFGNSFHADVTTEPGKTVNLVFKDSAENWDNNCGMNYTFM